jgi:hypothetical protein
VNFADKQLGVIDPNGAPVDLIPAGGSGGTAPVTSVNTKVGDVVLTAADVGAAPTAHTHTAAQITDFAEAVDDRAAALIKAGANTTVTYDDAANTLTIASQGGALPARLGPAWNGVLDLNLATETGWFSTWDGANRPTALQGWFVYTNNIDTNFLRQTAFGYMSATAGDTLTYQRDRQGGAWGAWYKLQTSQAEQDARYALPARLGANAVTVTDWNNALENGWYFCSTGTNAPVGDWCVGRVEAINSANVTQTVHAYAIDGSGNTYTYRRSRTNNVWSAWYKLQLSQAEQDARYALAGHTHPVVRSIDANDSSAGLRITQQGTGWALLVEDEASPDATPFAVSQVGNVLIGSRGSIPTIRPNGAESSANLQVNGDNIGGMTTSITGWSTNDQPPAIVFSKANSDVIGTHRLVAQGEQLGTVQFNASNGTAFMRAAAITAVAEGTPTASGIPARIEFRVWDGVQAVYTDAMRINSKGALAFNGAKYGAAGQALLSSGNAASPVWGTNLYVMEEDVAALKQKALDLEKALAEAFNNLATTLEAAETKISSLKGLVTKANNKIADLETRLTAVETGLGTTGGA